MNGTRGITQGLSSVLSYLQLQSEEPEESEPSKGQDSLTDQKQADSVVGSWVWAHRAVKGREIRLDVG